MKESDLHLEIIGLLFRKQQIKLGQIIGKELLANNIGLKNGHLSALFGLDREPGVNGARLAKATLISAQSMNTKLRQLETIGFLERRENPNSLRADSWYLTDKGRLKLTEIRLLVDNVMLQMLSGFNKKEIDNLQNYMNRCIDALDTIELKEPD